MQVVIEEATTPTRERKGFKFPFDQLGVAAELPDGRLQGPSFFVADEVAGIHLVRSHSINAGSKLGCRFSVRKDEKDGVPGCRVWRAPEPKRVEVVYR